MGAAEFIDVILTPLLGGLGAFWGMRIAARKKAEGTQAGLPRWIAPLVGVSTALLLFAGKMATN